MEYHEIRHGDRVWRIRYSMRALRWFEERSGTRFASVVQSFNSGEWSFTEFCWLVAAGLMTSTPQVMLDDVDALLETVGMEEVLTVVGAAIEASSLTKSSGAGSGTAEGNAVVGTGTS